MSDQDARSAAQSDDNLRHAEEVEDSLIEEAHRIRQDESSAASTPVHEISWRETILRLRAGEHAPVGYEIKRVIGVIQQPTGGGANYEDVFVVACREVGRNV